MYIAFIDINKYPGVRIENPPKVTLEDPMTDMNFRGLVRGFGVFLLIFGLIIVGVTVTSLVGTFRKSKTLTNAVSQSL